MAECKRAKRMSPEQRREQILDSAVDLIVARGLTSCTLEEVAVQARISKPVIYKYFSRLQDLLKGAGGTRIPLLAPQRPGHFAPRYRSGMSAETSPSIS
jgi:AcrR family transcriptional regulator